MSCGYATVVFILDIERNYYTLNIGGKLREGIVGLLMLLALKGLRTCLENV